MKKANKQQQSALPIEAIDSIIKSGMDPFELMKDMKRAIMERALNVEMDYHLENNKNDIVQVRDSRSISNTKVTYDLWQSSF